MLRVAVERVAFGSDDLHPEHALARRPDDLAVPAVSTLQQIPAEANALAVARREEQALCVEVGRKRARDHARPDVADHRIGVDKAVTETAHVEQHPAVAQMACVPTVSARTNADLVALGPRVADRSDDVIGVTRLHDHLGKALRYKAVPHRLPTGRLVAVYTAVEEPLCGE